MSCGCLVWSVLFSTMFLLLPLRLTAQNVLTWHNDVSRTGQNLMETTLTLANVNSTQFGLKLKLPVDGHIFTQPLYVSTVSILGKGTHNVIYVGTENRGSVDGSCLTVALCPRGRRYTIHFRKWVGEWHSVGC